MGKTGEKYRPSNGTEGMIFMDSWCDRCRKDAEFRKDARNGCPIAAATMCYNVDDAEYPDEWTYGRDGEPVCTAFLDVAAPKPDPVDYSKHLSFDFALETTKRKGKKI